MKKVKFNFNWLFLIFLCFIIFGSVAINVMYNTSGKEGMYIDGFSNNSENTENKVIIEGKGKKRKKTSIEKLLDKALKKTLDVRIKNKLNEKMNEVKSEINNDINKKVDEKVDEKLNEKLKERK